MLGESKKPWQDMTRAERRQRFEAVLADLEAQRLRAPRLRTFSDWRDARNVAIFCYSILETDGELRPTN